MTYSAPGMIVCSLIQVEVVRVLLCRERLFSPSVSDLCVLLRYIIGDFWSEIPPRSSHFGVLCDDK